MKLYASLFRNPAMMIALIILALFMPTFVSAQTLVGCAPVGTITACGNGDPLITYKDADGTVRTRAIIANSFGVASGYGSQATGRGDVAVGAYAYTGTATPAASADGDAYRTAVGYDAQATGYLSVAVGAFNHATGTGSVVLGYGSNDGGQDYVVSVGGTDDNGNAITRRVTNVADGVAASDVATVGQVTSQVTTLSNSTDTKIASVNSQIATVNSQYATLSALPVADVNAAQVVAGDAATLASANNHADAGDVATLTSANSHADAGDVATLSSANSHADAGDVATLGKANAYTDQSVNGLKDWTTAQNQQTLHDAKRFAAKGVAQALAIPVVPFLAPGQRWVGAAVGSYAGEQAVGIAAGYQVSESVNLGAGVSRDMSTSKHLAFRVQGGYAF